MFKARKAQERATGRMLLAAIISFGSIAVADEPFRVPDDTIVDSHPLSSQEQSDYFRANPGSSEGLHSRFDRSNQHFTNSGVPTPADTHAANEATASDGNAHFDVSRVLDALENSSELQPLEAAELEYPWWREHAERQLDASLRSVPAGVNKLIQLTLENSAQVRVYAKTPQIRETAVTQAAAAFDWTHFLDATWSDINDPVGSSLTVGGTGDRFIDRNINGATGFRRRLLGGGTFDISQRLGHQNTNSQFFIPNNQGTARLTLGYTQPLLRGRGKVYNTSLYVLAQIDVNRATDEYKRQLQQHLLEVARGYWSLYLERAKLAQRVKLYLRTQFYVDQLTNRQAIDAQRSQLVQATAALESRRSDLIRARAAVQNAETRLRALINSPELDSQSEILPLEHPTLDRIAPVLDQHFAIALKNRPEVRAAVKEIRSSSIRLDMAKHEILPVLNLVTNTYVSGLQGRSRVGDAFLDQFRDGGPSYSVGFEWEMPVGRRAASANVRRRHLEKIQLTERYRSTLELVKAEVEVAVREVETSYRELSAKNRSRKAAETEVETLEVRWKSLGGRDNNATLMLESLLQAQARVTQAEEELAQAQLTYSLSLINLRHSNGTLLQLDHFENPAVETASPADFLAPSSQDSMQLESTIIEHNLPSSVLERSDAFLSHPKTQ